MLPRAFSVLFLALVLLLFAVAQCPGKDPALADSLFSQFQHPPKEYSPMPFWFWNGKLEGAQVQEQVCRMVDQHVYGAFLHGRDGL
jgi:hypothetical protein